MILECGTFKRSSFCSCYAFFAIWDSGVKSLARQRRLGMAQKDIVLQNLFCYCTEHSDEPLKAKNMPLCGARSAQRVGEDKSSLLDVYGKLHA